MTPWNPLRRRGRRTGLAPRIGLFGLLGAGNLGNDGSLEAILGYLRSDHPGAVIAALCSGPEQVRQRYGVAATDMHWYTAEDRTVSGIRSAGLKAIGKLMDAGRTLYWVRNQDAVIVPGAGVLEATLPVRPWDVPYALLCLSAAGRLTDTKVMLVSVGADHVRERTSRWVLTKAASLAHYRSYRDNLSRDAMRGMGVDTAADAVYPDLVFALPTPAGTRSVRGTVGVGVMSYHGSNDDRRRADEINRSYLDTLKRFVRWLIDQGKHVRLFVGDNVDVSVVEAIVADLRKQRPGLDPARAVFQPAASLSELMQQMAAVDTVVATRYHNVLCALKLSKPTLSIGYGAKNDTLMESMGLGEFCQSARSIDFDQLVDQFRVLEKRGDELTTVMRERNRKNRTRLSDQFGVLSKTLSAADESTKHAPEGRDLS